MFVEINDELVMVKTATDTWLKDIDIIMAIVADKLRIIKSNAKTCKVSSKPISGHKRYDVDIAGQIGTKTKLRQELEWWLDNGYHVTSIKSLGYSGIIEIKTANDDFHPFCNFY